MTNDSEIGKMVAGLKYSQIYTLCFTQKLALPGKELTILFPYLLWPMKSLVNTSNRNLSSNTSKRSWHA